MSYDLMLLTREPLDEPAAQALFDDARKLLSAAAAAVLTWDDSWNADPEMAVDELLDGLDGEDIDADEYVAFCKKRGLSADLDQPSPEAAARFLGAQAGFPLMTFTLPEAAADARTPFAAAVELARARDLILHDPQTGRDVDLKRTIELPPSFS